MVEPGSSWKQRRVGERLGRYVLGRCIGAGGAAAVYMARLDGPRGFERLLAVKLVHEHLLEDKDFVAMFLDEANLSVRLSHPNIVHTYELAHQDDRLFIAMEFLHGKPLSSVYRRAFEQGAPLDYALVAWIGARAAEALHSAHELRDESGARLKVVHRDVSPDNLFLTYDGQVKVLDFGIARAEGRLAHTDLGHIKGKFRYMSPEYALGQHFDHTLDLFALGATLYEAALGLAAFSGADETQMLERLVLGEFADPRKVRPDFPADLESVIRRALDGESTRRFASGAQMASELDALAGMTAGHARELVEATLRALFPQEIRQELTHIAELRALRSRPSEDELTPLQHHLSVRPRPARRANKWGLAVVLAAGAAVPWIVGNLAATRGAAPEDTSTRTNAGPPAKQAGSSALENAATFPSQVSIELSLQPVDATAEIRVAGERLTGRPARATLPRGTAPVAVEVLGPGLRPVHMEVIPDRDRSLLIPMIALPAAAPSSRPKPVTLARKTAASAPPIPVSSTVRAEAPPPPDSDVIRANPFGP
jgi:serine/threonine-protein kinase